MRFPTPIFRTSVLPPFSNTIPSHVGSEPVVVTFNTLECVVTSRHADTSVDTVSASATKTEQPESPPMVEEVENSGYVQSLITRIKNNVSLSINNLILKFVEDNVVLSVNVKSAEAHSCDSAWQKAFAEVAAPNFLLHKIASISDLTICLDHQNSAGKIEIYQEPLLYRCSLDLRLRFTFLNQSALIPSLTQFHILCRQLDVSISDSQVNMLLDLVNNIYALILEYLPEMTLDQAKFNKISGETTPDLLADPRTPDRVKPLLVV